QRYSRFRSCGVDPVLDTAHAYPEIAGNLSDRLVGLGDQTDRFSLELRTISARLSTTTHGGLLRRIVRPKGVHTNGSTPIMYPRAFFVVSCLRGKQWSDREGC